MIGRGTLILAIAFTALAGTAHAQGSPQDRAACTPPVKKYCKHVPKNAGPFEFLACLQQNRARIGKACQGVLARNGV